MTTHLGKPCKHGEHVEGCHSCKLYATHEGYRKRWDGVHAVGGGRGQAPGGGG
jgi:hypothetical protein